ncbi:MAG: tetratricopeptide repeat protein, partial [Myxococcales bacterium]|nr:tetratricopeptide repeat protein [Myxococcales bacterium]
AAEPYFEKVRRVDPTHRGMLRFVRERCAEKGDKTRLAAILMDAQRACTDEEQKRTLATELASLAEGQANARAAIDQYKAILRAEPNDAAARTRLMALYTQAESWNALLELHRQQLQRLPKEEVPARVAVLREMAAIYRDRAPNDAAWLTAMTQLHQLDERDVDTVRGLVEAFERLERWRDLIQMQQKLADLTDSVAERAGLLRAVARRWLDQFSNVQNAMVAYEALLEAAADDIEAREKLSELYQKRRIWPKLFELYEKQLASGEPDDRVEILTQMAKLAAERLERGDDAIRLWRQIYAAAPDTEGVLDALDKLAERQKDFATQIFVVERRVEAATDNNTKLHLLLKLGALQSTKLEDEKAAADTWRRVLAVSPGHTKALRALRQSYVDAHDYDGLEALYASQGDWESLAEFLTTSADRVEGAAEKIDLSFRAARIFATELAASERAARSYERVLVHDSKNLIAAEALVRLYEVEEKWSRLPGLYAVLLGATEDVDAKIGLLQKSATVIGGPLGNKALALQHARRAYDLRPNADGLRRLKEWSQQSGEWSTFIEVLGERIGDPALSPGDARSLRLMLADVYCNQGRLDDGVELYRRLVTEQRGDKDTVGLLERVLRSSDRRDDLRWLFELQAASLEGEARLEVLEDWATLEEEVFGEEDRAIELYERIVSAGPSRTTALGSLARLLTAKGHYERAAQVLAARRDASQGGRRLAIELELCKLYLAHLEAPEQALEGALRVLISEPASEEALGVLEQLLARASVRRPVAERLEALYGERGQHEKRASALRVMLELEDAATRRIELCGRLADLLEHDLSDSSAAFEVALNTLLEAPANLSWWDRAQALSVAAGKPTDLAEAYRTHLSATAVAPEVALDDALVLELCERAASLHERELGDADGAVSYYERMLAIEPQNATAFERLEATFEVSERWLELEQLYGSRAAVVDSDADRIAMWLEAAKVAEQMCRSQARAIEHLSRVRELEPNHELCVTKLELLFAGAERNDDLARLLEQRIDSATDLEAVPLRLRLGALYLDKLANSEAAFPHVEAALRARNEDPEATRLAEACLALDGQRPAAALLLDEVYTARDDVGDLVRVLRIRLSGANTSSERSEILHRVATLAGERLKDDEGSFEALSALVPLGPDDDDVRRRFVEVGQRLGRHSEVAMALRGAAATCDVITTRAELLMAAAAIHIESLDQTKDAEALYREVLALDPGDAALVVSAAEALAAIFEDRADHAALAGALVMQAKLTDGEPKVAILERVALLYDEVLEDHAKAISAWRDVLASDPGRETALRSLERLYGQSKQFRELCEVLRQHEQHASTAGERERCLVRCAEVLSDELGQTSEAITAWRGVVDDFGSKPASLAALAKLYQRALRWEDLAEVLDAWLSLEEDRGQQLELHLWLGDLRRKHLGEARSALDSYREVLARDGNHGGARGAIEILLEHEDPEIRREAAQIIGPIYRAEGDAERLLKVLEIEIASTFDSGEKLRILERALATAEDVVQDAARAFGFACRAVREALGDPALGDWLATAERLAGLSDTRPGLLELYESIIEEILDADLKQSTLLSAASIARTVLKDRVRAIKLYRTAIEARGDDRDALTALEELYVETLDHVSLLEVLELRAESATDQERVGLLLRAAKLKAGPLDDIAAAIRTYEDVIELEPVAEAVVALEGLYRKNGQFDALVRVYERQLEALSEKAAVDVRARIATIALENLADSARALDELAIVLKLEPEHEAAVATLAGMLTSSTEPEQKALVAEMLEPVYMARSEWKKLQHVLEARLAHSQDPSLRAELLQRLGALYEEQLEDFAMALETAAHRLREEPGDEAIWKDVERLGRVLGSGSESRVAEIFAAALSEVGADDPKTAALCERTAQLFVQVSRPGDALVWFRRSHAFSPDSPELFEAIDDLLVQLERSEERIEHYRGALDDVFDDAKKVVMLRVIGELTTQLGQDQQAIDTWCSLLDIAPDDEGALDLLEALYRKLDREEDLCELYLRRAEAASEPERAAGFRIALAAVYAARPDGNLRALDQLEEIVRVLPAHASAIAAIERMLGDLELDERAVDLLRSLYEASDAWQKLVALGRHRVARTEDPLDKAGILLEVASLWEERGADLGQAFDATREAFETAPHHAEARAEFARRAAQTERFVELADGYEKGLLALDAQDTFGKLELLRALSSICDERLDDPRRTLSAMRRAAQLEPSDPGPLDRMDDLAMLLGDWEALRDVLVLKAEEPGSPEERANILERLGELKQDMLDDEDGATATLEQALEIAPESIRVIDRLISLYEGREPRRLVELLERRIDGETKDAKRVELAMRAACAYETELEDRDSATRRLSLALDLSGADLRVLTELERLHTVEERWADLLANLETQALVRESHDERMAIRKRIAALHLEKLDSPLDAIEGYAFVLELESDDADALARLRKIGADFEAHREEVARILEPIHTAAGRFADLVDVLELRCRAEDLPEQRARTLLGIATIQEEQLDSPAGARDTLLRALSDAVLGDSSSIAASCHVDLERLCALTESWDAYAVVLERLATSSFDGTLACDLNERLGRICERNLAQAPRAIAAYGRAVAQSDEPSPYLAALDRLYTSAGDFKELTGVLARRIELESRDPERAELLFRAGTLRVASFDDSRGGLESFSEGARLAPEHSGMRAALEELTKQRDLFEDAAEVLDMIYRVGEDSAARARLRRRRIDYAESPSERVRLRLELAQMLEDESSDTLSAQDVIEQALADDPSDGELVEHLARLATTNAAGRLGVEAWQRAAKALTHAVMGALDGTRSADESRGSTNLSVDVACDRYATVAGWYEEHVHDSETAEQVLGKALELDEMSTPLLERIERLQRVRGRERELVRTLRRLATLADGGGTTLDRDSAELRREAKVIAATVLSDGALAEAILRELLEANETDTWALAEMSDLWRERGKFDELLELLERRIDIEIEPTQIRALRLDAASIAAEKLDDPARAADLYEQLFETDPSDEQAVTLLRRTYVELGRYADILRLTERLLAVATDADVRARLSLESAEICLEKLDAPTEAIAHLNAAITDVPGHVRAGALLKGLLDTEGRHEELGEFLAQQIDTARESGNSKVELELRLELAALYDTRIGDESRALDAYLAVLDLVEDHPGGLAAVARLYENSERLLDAAETYEKLLGGATGAERVPLVMKICAIHASLGTDVSDDTSCRVLESLLGGADGISEAARRQAEDRMELLLKKRGAFAELARLVARRASEADDDDDRVRLWCKAAEIHAGECDDHAAAADLYERAASLQPQNRELLLVLCDAYTAAGRADAAVDALKKVVESYGGRRTKELADIHMRIASAQLARGDDAAALVELEAARKMDAGSVLVLVELGKLSLTLADRAADTTQKDVHVRRAAGVFKSLLLQRLDDGGPIGKADVFYYLAEVNRRDGESEKAIHNLERAVASDNAHEQALKLLDELRP